MSQSDNLFKGLVGRAITEGINSSDSKNKPAETRLYLALLGILLFLGAEGVKIIFRKNFGARGIHMPRLIICFLCFLIIGIMGITYSFDPKHIDEIGDSMIARLLSSYFIMGVFFAVLAFFIMRKGIIELNKAKKAQDYSNYEGDSDLLSSLSAFGWSQNTIQHFAEPVYTLLLGFMLLLYNPIFSIPFIFCALSVWGYALMEHLFIENPLKPDLQNTNLNSAPNVTNRPSKANRVNTEF